MTNKICLFYVEAFASLPRGHADRNSLASSSVPELSSTLVPDLPAPSSPNDRIDMSNVQVHLSSPTKVIDSKSYERFHFEESNLEEIRLYHAPEVKQSNDHDPGANSITINLNDICEGKFQKRQET